MPRTHLKSQFRTASSVKKAPLSYVLSSDGQPRWLSAIMLQFLMTHCELEENV